jgi:hypothetical protein
MEISRWREPPDTGHKNHAPRMGRWKPWDFRRSIRGGFNFNTDPVACATG